jgi:hypothetical protein
MDLIETSTQSFVIKIWVEETVEEAGEALWRGHITHVLSGERHHFGNIEEMIALMGRYLKEVGIQPFQNIIASRFLL